MTSQYTGTHKTPLRTSRPPSPELAFRASGRLLPTAARAAGIALAAACALLAAWSPRASAATSPDPSNYERSPIANSSSMVPRVLIVLSKDHNLHTQAYGDLIDMDDDGLPDTGFNPSVDYYGYFDSKSCYKYTGDLTKRYVNGQKDAYFVRVGSTREDESQEVLDDARPDDVEKRGIKAARAENWQTHEKIGICQLPNSGGGNFSGNWLNYVSMTRMDVIRKLLYGGYRWLDENPVTYDSKGKPIGTGFTQLQSSLVPRDSHTWGSDVLADDRWADETPASVYYDVSKFTPFAKPKPGSAHFFARTRNKTASDNDKNHFPVVEFILNANESYDPSYPLTSAGENKTNIFEKDIVLTGKAGRYFDWVFNQSPIPSTTYALKSDGSMKGELQSQGLIRTMTINVNVCDPANYSESENCRAYPNGNLKPAGLLQQHGESGQMLFALLTGSYHFSKAAYKTDVKTGQDTRRKGGVLRNHMTDLSARDTGLVTDANPKGYAHINLDTGQFIQQVSTRKVNKKTVDYEAGIIRNIDSLVINSGTTSGDSYYDTASAWGNPVGELLYEGVRYFARLAEDPAKPPTIE
ncbi:MAG: hypothetical protein LBG06_02960, partial [Deltaproteobacteria bacterium]|nr:hypothetical protein [Deltaproteobacteria bacterium]